MGTAGAVIYSAHLKSNTTCFNCLSSHPQPTALLRIDQTKSRSLVFSNRKGLKKLSGTICSAVEDVTKKQMELGGGSLIGVAEDRAESSDKAENPFLENESDDKGNFIYNFLYPSKELLPDDKEMSIYDHLEELRSRLFVSVLAVGGAMVGCFAFSKELIMFLEKPVSAQGVRFLQLAPGEFFFTSLKVSGYCGLLVGSPVILYEIIAFILPGLTKDERRFLGPIVLGSSILFYIGIAFSYYVLTPAALTFFVSYAEGVVESLWSIDQYFEFVLVLMFSTGLSFQVPVIQLLLGQVGLVSSEQMFSIWRYVVVGSVIAAAILTPSTDPLTQMLLAGPLMGLYLGGAWTVKLLGR
ncbi:sec-independent protein translocase protein TATC, chloroplastic-like [Salvia hispanica]|uniref:sec-independent protein translocase protein TATC, chloroplastic-like n=1 Tax=Salvia hispanica TaxID=49212 RepID=UPI002009D905|nr:sec-independent protein translocase protein TATC, chloroplastic-like [Salvia hispanica]